MEGTMQTFKKFTICGALAAFSLVAASCGDAYDRTEFVDEMVQAGLNEEQAGCVADRAESEIGLDRLNSRGSDPTPEEEEILASAVVDCMLGG